LEQTLTLPVNSVNEQNDAIHEVIERERGRLRNFIKKKVSSEDDAEDILQDVLYQFVAAIRMEPVEKAAAWLFRTAGNKIIDWYRKIKPFSLDKINEQAHGEDDASGHMQYEDKLYGNENNPDILFFRNELWPAMEDALNELPEEQREVFIMHELENKSFKEIAETTGEKINTLISRKRYAVQFLRSVLRDVYDNLLDN
jgi:RNA polymerase sigma factor (sigma-70 family)